MSSGMSMIGGSVLALIVAGYLGQKYGLPPPPPKIAGIDLGTTFSSIGIYHAVSGDTTIIPDAVGKRSVPSVVGFLPNGTVIIGTRAVAQQEINPTRTIYDAKRFIGRTYVKDNADFIADTKRYPFVIKLDDAGRAFFEIPLDAGIKKLYPEEVGALIIKYLKEAADRELNADLQQVVISVPAEFDEVQRNYTGKAAELAGMEVRRVISEPTAAALAYGLHKKKGVETVVVVDMGGGTLDVSVLWLQGGVFVTQAMAGNNRLGGQDLNDNTVKMLTKKIASSLEMELKEQEDIQQLRLAVEKAKIELTSKHKTQIDLKFVGGQKFHYELTRDEFESLNEAVWEAVREPIDAALKDADLEPSNTDEIVLVGGSTRIPRVRKLVGHFFGKAPNFGVDPELAVVTGASVQAGVIGGGWPLQVAAMELPSKRRKRHFFSKEQERNEMGEAAEL